MPPSLLAATIAGAAPTMRRPPPPGAVKHHLMDDADGDAIAVTTPARGARGRKALAAAPKIVSAAELQRTAAGVVGASRTGANPNAGLRAPLAKPPGTNEEAPEVSWADDCAPSGLPNMGMLLSSGRDVDINLQVLLRSRMLITASSGAGKSWAVRRLVEQTAPLVQQLIIDPEGEFETLAEKFPFAVFGNGKDKRQPLSDCDPAALAQHLVKTGVSAVLDISDYDEDDKQKFVADFIQGLMDLEQEHWRHVMVVLDEAHLFAPQWDKSPSKKPVINLATRGRKRGLCPVLATQRFSMLNKSVAAELQNRMIGLTVLDRDLKRAADELGMPYRQAAAALSSFVPGNFFVYGPALTKTVQRMMVGPVVTSHGVDLGEVRPPATPTEDTMAEIYTAAERKKPELLAAGQPGPAPAAGAAAAAARDGGYEALRHQIAVQRAALVMPIVRAEGAGDAAARAAAIRFAADAAGVTTAAIYQWLNKIDPENPVVSMMPARVPRAARVLGHMPIAPQPTAATAAGEPARKKRAPTQAKPVKKRAAPERRTRTARAAVKPTAAVKKTRTAAKAATVQKTKAKARGKAKAATATPARRR